MTVTVSQTPTYQLPNKTFYMTFSATDGNFVRVMVTAAPPSSGYAQRIIDEETSELEIGATATGQVWTGFEPDAPGVYTLKAYELTVGASTYGGYFESDTDGYSTETVEGSTTLTIYVGQRLESTIGTPADNATLVLHVWNSTVRATTVEQHGIDSPDLINPSSARAETFVSDSGVVAALANFEDRAASTVASAAYSVLDNELVEFEDHLLQAGVHAANDTDNTPAVASLRNALTEEQLVTSVAELQRLYRQHCENDAGAGGGAGSASSNYHTIGDRINGPIAPPPSDYASAIFAVADLWRGYEAHRVSTVFHSSADTTNSLTALTTGSLLALCKEVSDVLATPTPTAPSTDNPGATSLVHRGGFKRV